MANIFDVYALYYDLLYQEKNYIDEAKYIEKCIKKYSPKASSILELGCGTGNHAEYLVKNGYNVHGIDISKKMLERAEARKAALPQVESRKLSFAYGDVRYLKDNNQYDVVISLFHVMSYQTANVDLSLTIETAAKHLKPGGIFLFDFWYGPAVLKQRPDVRVKRLQKEDVKLTRIAEPVLHVNENVVDVNYTIFIEQNNSDKITEIYESHKMRYLFLPELYKYLDSNKWKEFDIYKWMSNDVPDENSWSAFVVAVKNK